MSASYSRPLPLRLRYTTTTNGDPMTTTYTLDDHDFSERITGTTAQLASHLDTAVRGDITESDDLDTGYLDIVVDMLEGSETLTDATLARINELLAEFKITISRARAVLKAARDER